MVMVMGGRRAVKYTLEKVNGICTHICPGVLHMSLCCAAGQTSQIADALLRVAIRNSVAERSQSFHHTYLICKAFYIGQINSLFSKLSGENKVVTLPKKILK